MEIMWVDWMLHCRPIWREVGSIGDCDWLLDHYGHLRNRKALDLGFESSEGETTVYVVHHFGFEFLEGEMTAYVVHHLYQDS